MFINTPDGQRIRYKVIVGRSPVLLVHGFASDSGSTWEASGWLRTLEENDRGAVLVDLRGHGESSLPAAAAKYSPSILAADLVAVLDAAGLQVVDALGYSMGSQVVRQLSAQFPERVSRIVIGGIGSSDQFTRWGIENLSTVLLNGKEVDDPTMNGLILAARSLPDGNRRALVACATGMASHPVTAKGSAPTLLLAGDMDPVAEGAEAFSATIGAQFHAIPRRHHSSTLSARAFKSLALDFLSQ